jgi:hypothetical protein
MTINKKKVSQCYVKTFISTANINIVNLSTEITKCNLRTRFKKVLFMLLIRPKVFALY